MKKFFVLLFIFVIILGTNVYAASLPYDYIIDGKEVSEKLDDGSAIISKDSTSVTLTLNNYNGGPIKLNCYGSGQSGIKFNINLIGENTISADDIGIDFDYSVKKDENVINFTGDGKLTITAKTPISYEDYSDKLYIIPSENVHSTTLSNNTSEKVNNDNTSKDKKTTKEETNKDEVVIKVDKTSIILYSFIGYIIISLIVISYLSLKIRKLENL
jgi:hypothetical protein